MRAIDADGHESKYFGVIKNIIMYSFAGNKNMKIVFFDYDWFDPRQEEEEQHEEEEGHYDGEARHYEDKVMGGDGSTSGSTSSRRCRSSHLTHPHVVPHEENRVVIVPSGDA
jgi:hypothetical protein